MIIGYARTSTAEQEAGLEAQLRDLRANGAEKIFSERISSVGERVQLDAALAFVREGDTLLVTKVDRLARSIRGLLDIAERLKARGVKLHVMNLGLIDGSPTSQLTLHILGAIAEFERVMMLERQKEGITKAKAEGKYKGRPVNHAKRASKEMQVAALRGTGKSSAAIARELGMSQRTLFRILKQAK
jgi:DNA invertase Pin-like site-specific DNA recombinase